MNVPKENRLRIEHQTGRTRDGQVSGCPAEKLMRITKQQCNALLNDWTQLQKTCPNSSRSQEIKEIEWRKVASLKTDLRKIYQNYIECLNRRDWASLGNFVDTGAVHNDRSLGLAGYREMLEKDVSQVPDLYFTVELLVADEDFVASRLRFNVTPIGAFLGLPVNGRRISFTENVFYKFENGKIAMVWSVLDKSAIEAQL